MGSDVVVDLTIAHTYPTVHHRRHELCSKDVEADLGAGRVIGRRAEADDAAAVQRAVATLEAEQFARVAKAHISPVV